jgi:hypothetical protein
VGPQAVPLTDDSADPRLVDEFTARGARVIAVNPDRSRPAGRTLVA